MEKPSATSGNVDSSAYGEGAAPVGGSTEEFVCRGCGFIRVGVWFERCPGCRGLFSVLPTRLLESGSYFAS